MRDNIPIINDGPDADEIAEMVMECVKDNAPRDMLAFKVEEITRETNLRDDLWLDPLEIVELIMAVEKKLSDIPPYYSVSIPEEVCEGIETVGDLVDAACKAMGVKE